MKSLFSIGVFLFLIVYSSLAFSQELFLEFDPDEYRSESSGSQNLSSVYSQNFSSDMALDSSEILTNPYLRGYQELFSFNMDELAGFRAVLLPLRSDLSQIDTQLQVLSQQMDRIRRLDSLMNVKMQGLVSLDTKLSVQEKLLSLEMKNVTKKFEKILILFLNIKRQFISDDGSFDFSQLFTSSRSPRDLLFQDFLLNRLQDQLLNHIQLLSYKSLRLGNIRNSLSSVQDQLDMYREKISSSSQIIDQQLAYQSRLYKEKMEEEQFFEKNIAMAKEEREFITMRIREIATGDYTENYSTFPIESFIWPVSPVLGISTYFRDPEYKTRFGIEHNAIDIPTDQLTSVKAVLSGRVLELHDGGFGYSYLQIGHRDGLSTVYGHLYSFKVSKGDMVQQGQVIALSGGALGTKGAGTLTTGPHLHFEVLKDGEYVDPLGYLSGLK